MEVKASSPDHERTAVISTGGAVADTLTKGSRITGDDRAALGASLAARYQAGESIRALAEDIGRSFGFVHGVITEAGVVLRGRGGATRGATVSGAAAVAATKPRPTSRAAASKASGRADASPTGTRSSAAGVAAKPTKKSDSKKADGKKPGAKKAKTKKADSKKAKSDSKKGRR